jgi:hypothetical protein
MLNTTTPERTALPAATTKERFSELDKKVGFEDYNYRHFRTRVLVRDAERTIKRRGLKPGEVAPDFALQSTDGSTIRLSDLRGRPVLIHFGSFT